MLVSSREVIFLAHQKIWCHKIRIDHTLLPYRGRIKVNDHAVHKILGIPIGEEHIDYTKNSFSDTYEEFYKFYNNENDQKAPSFTEAENWLLEKEKRSDTLWLWYWLEFAISSFLCPTSSTTLCVCGPSMRLQIQQRSENIIGADLWLKGCLKVSQSSIKEKGNQAASFS